jgi:hypothetical protein
MYSKTNTAFIPLLIVALSGCQSTNGQGRQALVELVPANYRGLVAAYLRKTLKDPYSVRDAEISGPTDIFVGLINGGTAPGVCVRMNAKNSFGGYIGIETSAGVIRNGEVVGMGPPSFSTCQNVTWHPFQEIIEQPAAVGRN